MKIHHFSSMPSLALLIFLACCQILHGEGLATNRLRILTYNIHHGEGTDQKIDLERIARIIRETQADLVALQEVDVKTQRTHGVDQAGELGRLTGLQAYFGQAMDYQGGGYGVAVLSRWPAVSTRIWPLPGSPGREPRVAFEVQVRAGGQGPLLRFINTHLDHASEPERLRQTRWILDHLSQTTNQLAILAGDLNATPESAPMRAIFEKWTDFKGEGEAWTIPAENPRRRIDYILARPGPPWRLVESRVINEPVASDHRPVLAVVELKGP